MSYTTSSNFVSKEAALKVYQPYGFNMTDIEDKIKAGAIAIGAPVISIGDTLRLNRDGQYIIEHWRIKGNCGN